MWNDVCSQEEIDEMFALADVCSQEEIDKMFALADVCSQEEIDKMFAKATARGDESGKSNFEISEIIARQKAEMEAKDAEMEAKDAEIRAKDATIEALEANKEARKWQRYGVATFYKHENVVMIPQDYSKHKNKRHVEIDNWQAFVKIIEIQEKG